MANKNKNFMAERETFSLSRFAKMLQDEKVKLYELQSYAKKLIQRQKGEYGYARVNFTAYQALSEMYPENRQRVRQIVKAFSDLYWQNWIEGGEFG